MYQELAPGTRNLSKPVGGGIYAKAKACLSNNLRVLHLIIIEKYCLFLIENYDNVVVKLVLTVSYPTKVNRGLIP